VNIVVDTHGITLDGVYMSYEFLAHLVHPDPKRIVSFERQGDVVTVTHRGFLCDNCDEIATDYSPDFEVVFMKTKRLCTIHKLSKGKAN
jgi:hypothetical protein